MDKKVSTATIVRTVCLALALVNQLLSAGGHSVIPIDNETVNQLVTAGVTIVTAIVNWWYNNSFTEAAIEADKTLERVREKNRSCRNNKTPCQTERLRRSGRGMQF